MSALMGDAMIGTWVSWRPKSLLAKLKTSWGFCSFLWT